MPKQTRLALESEADADLEPPEEFIPLPTSIDEEDRLKAIEEKKGEESTVKFDDAEDREIIEGWSFLIAFFFFLSFSGRIIAVASFSS